MIWNALEGEREGDWEERPKRALVVFMVVGSASAAAATDEKDLSENLLWWCAKNEGVQEKKGKEENRE